MICYRKRYAALILFLIVLLSGCSYRSGKKISTVTNQGTTAAVTSPSIESTGSAAAETGLTQEEALRRVVVSCTEEAQGYLAEDGETLLLEYRCAVPKVNVPGLTEPAAAINESLTALQTAFAEGYGEGDINRDIPSLLKEAGSALSDMGRESFTPYAKTRDVSVTRGDAAILSLVFDDYFHTGGAHGNVSRTGVTFDVETGERLTFSDLAEDVEALRELCLQQLTEQTAAMEQEGLFEGYAETLPQLMDNDCWYLSSAGLVFYADPYVLAPYAAGRLEFTVSYKSLSGLLHERYQIPTREGVQGGMNGSLASQQSLALIGSLLDLTLERGGETVILWAEQSVYEIYIYKASYAETTDEFLTGRELCYISRMDDGDFLRLTHLFPEEIPDLLLCWRLPDGTRQSYLLSLSGFDGSLTFTDPNTVELTAAEITSLLPYSFDFDGDGDVETVSLTETRLDSQRESAYTLTINGGSRSSAFNIPALDDMQLWAVDIDEDGTRELILSGRDSRNQYGVWFWRFDAMLTPAYVQDYVGAAYPARLMNAATGVITAQLNESGSVRNLTLQWSQEEGVWLVS